MKTFFILSLLAVSLSAVAGNYQYQPNDNPYSTLKSVIQKAKQRDKLVLLVFGSDWCPDCRILNARMSQTPLAETIQQHYEVMLVDIGEWDKNMAFTREFGKPVDEGIPSVAILDQEGKPLYVAEAGEFASVRHSKVAKLNTWFESMATKFNNNITN